jgi:N-acetylglutamate synthase-like GNAT family acetyltransferase
MKDQIEYKIDFLPAIDNVIELYESSGLKRPVSDKNRIAMMYANSNLIATAWHDTKLVGVSRALTDFCYCCYLSDLAIHKDYQKAGIGKKLIDITKGKIGLKTSLLLLSVPTAMDYYPKVGFEKIENGFIIKRSE